ncbi:hypothetical protein GGTG_05034 [Gaeumannomyces tritici R3-111a-1]|uniref:Rhodopsin domain-containing protein n=1 Tax=Gaeumannomyces tritici (strain R3-111a-1) TaxID=644352 RepID=J3NUS8_GAET3|nr:hypothetical protein GGTG_05034 [Gaeumannomyces tritici R3-111a-1]EJT79952.1 hypothetical protein GGTG_05034 [Gaeumannomyces tritici R3-111a-1]
MEVETQSPTVMAVAVAFAVITFVVVGLRLYARIFLVQHVGIDDYLIVVASLLSWAFIAATIRSAELGLGGHYADVIARGVPNFVAYLQTVWLSSIFYNACLGFIKASVLAPYMRLGDRRRCGRCRPSWRASSPARPRPTCWSASCSARPIRAAYDITIPATQKRRCIDINAFYLANAAVNILTDALTCALPIPLVLRLQVPLARSASGSGVICITFIPAMLASADPTWDIAQPMYWSVIETNVGILASSIPSTKVIAKRFFPRLLGSSSGGPRGSWSGGGGDGGGTGSSRNDKGDAKARGNKSFYYADSVRDDDGHEMMAAAPTRPADAQLSDEEALTGRVPEGRIGVTTHVQVDHQTPKTSGWRDG